ncbi:MAG: YlmC/YmxH family sporulation protein [Solirubrobacterales bacterium]
MKENIKFYNDLEKYEIININDGEKFNCLGNNDIIIDENGNLKFLILNDHKAKAGLFSRGEYIQVPWDCVKKVGSKTIIIDAEDGSINKIK